MTGVLDHFQDNVQVWDGLSYDYMPEKEARKLVKAGTHQISTGLSAMQLKTAAQFNEAREAAAKKAAPKNKAMKAAATATLPGVEKQAYKTREMKSE